MNLQLNLKPPVTALCGFDTTTGTNFLIRFLYMKKTVINLHIASLKAKQVNIGSASEQEAKNGDNSHDLNESGEMIEATLKSSLQPVFKAPVYHPEQEPEPEPVIYIEKSLSETILEIVQTDEDVRKAIKSIADDAIKGVVFRDSKN